MSVRVDDWPVERAIIAINDATYFCKDLFTHNVKRHEKTESDYVHSTDQRKTQIQTFP